MYVESHDLYDSVIVKIVIFNSLFQLQSSPESSNNEHSKGGEEFLSIPLSRVKPNSLTISQCADVHGESNLISYYFSYYR